jgi:alkylation response protein AidB-like acyl-CoA dehydrogenase
MAVALDFERAGVHYSSNGRRNLERLVQYAKETNHNGKPLSQHKVVRHKLVNLAVEIQASRWIAYRVAWMQGQGLVPNYEASMSKVFGSELQQKVANTGIEILGQYGQLWKNSKWVKLRGSLSRAYLNQFGANIAGGTGEIQRNIIATRGLGLPRQ